MITKTLGSEYSGPFLRSERFIRNHLVLCPLLYLEEELGLPVNEEKSQVTPVKSAVFLGFQILRGKIRVSTKARARFKDRVRELTRRNEPAHAKRLRQVSGPIERFTADGAYDKTAVYDLLSERGTEVVVPPTKNARVSKSTAAGARARNATVLGVREFGRREWKKRSGYHRQARVENAFYRYKQVIGGKLRSRNVAAQATEIGLSVNILNRMLGLGAARSEPIHN